MSFGEADSIRFHDGYHEEPDEGTFPQQSRRRMSLPVPPPIKPMLAKLSAEIPSGEGWLYEPKWDGFRAIVFREGDELTIGSRNSKPLERYFPEVVPALLDCLPQRAVVDGEIVIAGEKGLDFDALLLRIHPAASRVKMLSESMPSTFVAFDLIAEGDHDLRSLPFEHRRAKLEASVGSSKDVFLTPQTSDLLTAKGWFTEFEGAGLDGIVAKLAASSYLPGERAMVKVKHLRTVDCVVAGYRLAKDALGVGSLLLGLYVSGVLHYVGHTSSFTQKQKRELLPELQAIEGEGGFGMGRTPGGPSRWAAADEKQWVPLKPILVCEVSFDHLQGERFRHGATFLRWRPDRSPKDCTFAQLEPPNPFSLDDIRRLSAGPRGKQLGSRQENPLPAE